MRKVILFMHVSLDGFVCGPEDEMDWTTMKGDKVIFGSTSLAAHFGVAGRYYQDIN